MTEEAGLTIADRTLLLATRAWGESLGPRFGEAFRDDWRERLRASWGAPAPSDPEAARDRLRREHAAQARPDLARVHPSWWSRALKDESAAVRRAVAAHAPPAVREALRDDLGLAPEDLAADRPPHPDALRCALVLWTERLVGGVAERDDDPPAVVALTRLDLHQFTRLIKVTGLAKYAIAGEAPEAPDRRDRERYEHFRSGVREPSPRLRELARQDVGVRGAARRGVAQLGLVTIGRLLEGVEPYRVRWALQHVPYSVARFTRSMMSEPPVRRASLVAWETEVLKTAWDRLHDEGRLKGPFGVVA